MDAFKLEVTTRAGEALDAPPIHSPALAGAVVEPPRRPLPGARSFELPKGVFVAMTAAYVAFLAAMTAAFGGGAGMPLVLAICVLYLVMYLGIPTLFGAVDSGGRTRQLGWRELRQRGLDTAVGRMGARAVAGQVLIVPGCVAFFGLAILMIVRSL
jgi:hypothetical protein